MVNIVLNRFCLKKTLLCNEALSSKIGLEQKWAFSWLITRVNREWSTGLKLDGIWISLDISGKRVEKLIGEQVQWTGTEAILSTWGPWLIQSRSVLHQSVQFNPFFSDVCSFWPALLEPSAVCSTLVVSDYFITNVSVNQTFLCQSKNQVGKRWHLLNERHRGNSLRLLPPYIKLLQLDNLWTLTWKIFSLLLSQFRPQ